MLAQLQPYIVTSWHGHRNDANIPAAVKTVWRRKFQPPRGGFQQRQSNVDLALLNSEGVLVHTFDAAQHEQYGRGGIQQFTVRELSRAAPFLNLGKAPAKERPLKLPSLGGQRGMRVLVSLRDDRMRAYRAPVVEVVPMVKADWKPLAWSDRERTVPAAALKSWLSQIYPPGVIRQFLDLARARGIALILDETYKDFLPSDGAPHHLHQAPGWRDNLIQLFSFSKTYSLTGHRVGGLVAGPEIIAEITKGMDCAAICAPAVGQAAALYGLENLDDWKEEKRQLSLKRLAALRDAMARNDLLYDVVSAGAFFAYMRHPHAGKGATEVARHLADNENMLCLPGAFFGPGQDAYLRFSFANVEAERMVEIADRLLRTTDRR